MGESLTHMGARQGDRHAEFTGKEAGLPEIHAELVGEAKKAGVLGCVKQARQPRLGHEERGGLRQ